MAIPPVTWASESQTVAGINPTSGAIFAIAPGTTRITATVDGKVGERTVSVARAPAIRINEIQSRGDAPTGWIEFFNPTPVAVDVTEWALVDANFFGPTFTFPAGSVIPAGGLLVIEEASLPFGVDAADQLHLFSRFGVLVDVAFWTAQPTTTLGLCPGVLTAAIVVTTAPTKGTANACPPAGATLGTATGMHPNRPERRRPLRAPRPAGNTKAQLSSTPPGLILREPEPRPPASRPNPSHGEPSNARRRSKPSQSH